MEKQVKQYAGMYREAIQRRGLTDVEGKTRAYEEKLTQLYGSEAYRTHNVYPTMQVEKVYAVIAMCLMLKSYGLDNDDIINTVNDAFRKLKAALYRLEKLVDRLPVTWAIVKKWNTADHQGRTGDGSITYDFFKVEEDKISYRISRCMYAEMFQFYGIRELCKIFCMTDTQAYDHLTRHVKFVRHSDLSNGDCCWDEIIKL